MSLLFELYRLAAGYMFLVGLACVLLLAMFVFSVIGVIATIKWAKNRRKPQETPEEKWLKTGRID